MGLSGQELRNLAHEISAVARALADWGSTHPITDPTQQDQLDDFVSDLVQASNDLEDDAVAAGLANVAVAAADLQSATQKVQHTLRVIQDVEKVLAIAGAAAGVGAALLAPVPSAAAIATSVDGLAQAAGPTGSRVG